ncbi:MAG: DEAD/DEAH box helicase [Clostridia bacterium]|nr:DEAD/DEAH box helicase [Clostridia bacterium]
MTAHSDKSKNLISAFSTMTPGGQPQTVRLVPVLRINDDGLFLSLKIGTSRLYSVKEFAHIFKMLKSGEPIKFGKGFTFNPGRVEFTRNILGFINLMTVIFGENMPSGREVRLPEKYILPVMQQLCGEETEIIGGMSGNISVAAVLPALSFEALKQGGYIILRCDKLGSIVPLTKACDVIFFEGSIHVLKRAHAQIIARLKEAASDGSIVFKNEDKYDVITRVFPFVRQIGHVEIDSTIKKDVTVGQLKIKTYLDRTDYGTVSATVRFCYGGEEFNHFLGEKPAQGEKILIRDVRKENEFIRLAASLGFMPEEGVLYLSDEYKLYDFLSEGIFQMKELSEIFYSDRFNIEVVTPTKGNGGVSLGAGNMLEFNLSIEGIDDEELADIMDAVREKRKFYHLKSGSFVNLSAKPLSQAAKLLENVEADRAGGTVSLARAFFLEDLGDSAIKISGDDKFREFVKRFKKSETEVEIPPHIDSVLRPYQKTGVKWMKSLAELGFGGILADEMGLGKTLQTIAFVMSQYENNKKPTLIVVPTSLIFNWSSEIAKFAPEAKTVILSGSPQMREQAAENIADAHFAITSYGLLRNDLNLYSDTEFAYCFIDEAQHIKNPNTLSAKVVKQIKADSFFALTGTPLENTLLELWSVFDFVMPGYLYSRHKFRAVYELPIVKEKDKEALGMLQKHIRPFILRRLKSEVMAELPEKIESYPPCELTEEQKKLYIGFAEKAKEEVFLLGDNGEFEKNRIRILALLTRLRQLCCHPSLFIENYSGESGKLNLLKDIVESGIQAGHRILIFSQFTSMLGMISDMLSEMGISHYYLDGSTKSEQRFNMVKSFNEGMCDIFLVSLRAGGTGLNLTGADMVIHYDPWWNPAVENQATDRAHRIGQTKVVQVTKLIATGTIEEKICELKKLKQDMVDSVLETGETMLASLSYEEIKWLFKE